MKAVVIACTAFVAGAVGGVTLFVVHYDDASAPVGAHCWHEINKTQPMGIEKICIMDVDHERVAQ